MPSGAAGRRLANKKMEKLGLMLNALSHAAVVEAA